MNAELRDLATKAGFSNRIDDVAHHRRIAAFAALVAERCAQEAEVPFRDEGFLLNPSQNQGVRILATAIRALATQWRTGESR